MPAAKAAHLTYASLLSKVDASVWMGIAQQINEATWSGSFSCEVEVEDHHGTIMTHLQEELGYEVTLLAPKEGSGSWSIHISWENTAVAVEFEEDEL